MPANTGGGANLFQPARYYFRDGNHAAALKLLTIDPYP
jgi:hypothetical protein